MYRLDHRRQHNGVAAQSTATARAWFVSSRVGHFDRIRALSIFTKTRIIILSRFKRVRNIIIIIIYFFIFFRRSPSIPKDSREARSYMRFR